MLINLDLVLEAYGKHNLIIQPSKSNLFAARVTFLGHQVDEKGISPVPEYISAITRLPIPKSAKEGRAMLGKFGFQKMFIQDYAKIAQPLMEWTNEAERTQKAEPPDKQVLDSINTLKTKLTTRPILAYPQWSSNQKFRVYTDFSQRAIGAKITQLQPNDNGEMVERTLVYDSKLLKDAQTRYHSNKGELYAILWVCSKHHFLLFPRNSQS